MSINNEMRDLHQLVLQLTNADQRESALLELSKKREAFPDLAPVLWHSYGTIAVLLQEIISIFPMLSPPTLLPHASNRVCNALALLQCVASHPETKSKLLAAHIPLYLYPFLNTVSRHRPFEYLRLTSLGVIGALVKVDDPEVVQFLLQTEIIPLCLRIMETGSELSKTVATFIVQKILLDEMGLTYICATAERFYAVSNVLSGMVTKLLESPSVRLLKHIVRCYLRLSDHQKARDALLQCLPEALRDQSFAPQLRSEEAVQKWLTSLMKNINERATGTAGPTFTSDGSAQGSASASGTAATSLSSNFAMPLPMSSQSRGGATGGQQGDGGSSSTRVGGGGGLSSNLPPAGSSNSSKVFPPNTSSSAGIAAWNPNSKPS